MKDHVSTLPHEPTGQKEIAPIRWLRNEVDRLFDDVSLPSRRLFDWRSDRPDFPPVDLHEGKKDFTIQADLAGFKPQEVSLRLRDNMITISGQSDDFEERQEDGAIVCERHRGRFERRMVFPSPVNATAAKARFNRGKLTVHVPKSPVRESDEIAIEIEE